MGKFWSFFLPSKRKSNARYNAIISPSSGEEATNLWRIPPTQAERESSKRTGPTGQPQRLQRGLTYKDRKMRKNDLVNVFARNTSGTAPDPFEDEVIPGKAIVLKMPERSMKSYFIPCPVDLDGLKRRSIELFSIQDELDVLNRLEFELFAFGIIPSSASLQLLKDREVIYVNLLPPRPPTPFSLTLAPPRAENSLVAEVRRPGTGLPYEVVYTQQGEDAPDRPVVAAPEVSGQRRKMSRFKEHMSELGSRRSRSLSVGGIEEGGGTGKGVQKNPTPAPRKAWYKHDKSSEESERLVSPNSTDDGG